MEKLFRPKHVQYVDADGRRCAKTAPGARKLKVSSSTWYFQFDDAEGRRRRESLHTPNKAKAREAARAILAKVERQRQGYADPNTPLSAHLEDFRAVLAAADNSPKYVKQQYGRVKTDIRRLRLSHRWRRFRITSPEVVGRTTPRRTWQEDGRLPSPVVQAVL